MAQRNIITTYFQDVGKTAVMAVNRSKYARSACAKAFDYMSINFYEAQVCEVYDDDTARLHAVFTRDIATGQITPLYLRNPENPKFAGTSKDPFGKFLRRKAKSRTKLKRKVKGG